MSRQAVDLSLEAVFGMSDRDCLDLLVEARWGHPSTIGCPHCGTISRHAWRRYDNRWKCRACEKTFSITSGTVFADRKLRLQELIGAVLLWLNSAGGQPALELKRHANKSYNTVFTLQHKLREALVRGYNVGLLNGDIEVDGAHQSGWRSAEKRSRPQVSKPFDDKTSEGQLNAALLTGSAKMTARRQKRTPGAVHDVDTGRVLPPDRRLLIAVRKRSGRKGVGAIGTRVAIGKREDSEVLKAVFRDFVSVSESTLNTDTLSTYRELGRDFRGHRTVEHTETMRGPNGENNNQAEELNGRFDRAEKGTYLNIEPKYLLDYAVETAFRSDTRRLSNGAQLKLLLAVALNVGVSQYWRGFTRGRHRSQELLHPQAEPARASGPAKGRHPTSSANNRPPR